MTGLTIRSLCMTGPSRPPAMLTFGEGLNVVYGASDTGKSFVVEVLDFMFGGNTPLREIPERVGYDQILLAIRASDGEEFTIVRSVDGGPFSLYQGLLKTVPTEGPGPRILAPKHSSKNVNNLSTFLLLKIGLKGKWVRKNAKNETRELSIRDLVPLCVVTEGDIQKPSSPILGGDHGAHTAEYNVFKLLLTGTDDSHVVAVAEQATLSQAVIAKRELLDELIGVNEGRLREGPLPEALAEQRAKIDEAVARHHELLESNEDGYGRLLAARSSRLAMLRQVEDRRSEIGELEARFGLLDNHYRTDLSRLEGILEASTVLELLPTVECPVCRTTASVWPDMAGSDASMDLLASAATAESDKIRTLQTDLQQTVTQLRAEAALFDNLIPEHKRDLVDIADRLAALAPQLEARRTEYANLVAKRTSLSEAIAAWERTDELKAMRKRLGENTASAQATQVHPSIPAFIRDEFAQQIEGVLKSWNFPDAQRVQFDDRARDLSISGKLRTSRGKGMRAITHAAFTIGVMDYCGVKSLPHPGFVVLDSPLLAYRKPEGKADDLRGTDVQDRFYDNLLSNDAQVIIIENNNPPDSIRTLPSSEFFSKNEELGRYGFFPMA